MMKTVKTARKHHKRLITASVVIIVALICVAIPVSYQAIRLSGAKRNDTKKLFLEMQSAKQSVNVILSSLGLSLAPREESLCTDKVYYDAYDHSLYGLYCFQRFNIIKNDVKNVTSTGDIYAKNAAYLKQDGWHPIGYTGNGVSYLWYEKGDCRLSVGVPGDQDTLICDIADLPRYKSM